jgi:hypothetical protein
MPSCPTNDLARSLYFIRPNQRDEFNDRVIITEAGLLLRIYAESRVLYL